MKSLHLALFVVLMSLSTLAFAQSDARKPSPPSVERKPVVQSEAQKSFTLLKALAGNWVGPVTTEPAMEKMGNGLRTRASLHVTSRGNALVHELQEVGKPDDPTRYDHPLTMFYLDGDQLFLTHYCDAGNRPRMVANTSPDGKTVDFEFIDVAGSTQHGYMHHAVFTFIDANHHIEDWTYMMPGDKPLHAHLDLQREK